MILKGDCISVMKAMKPNSVDAIVCDPPYGLEFMGKEWDKFGGKPVGENYQGNGGIKRFFKGNKPIYTWNMKAFYEFNTQWLTEAYRVLKPGGSMLVMGGTRTSHRLACAIEDSGFIIKDTLMWLYGSGFPKAQDLGKMIDKRNGRNQEIYKPFAKYLKEKRIEKKLSMSEIDKKLGTNTQYSWYEGRLLGIQLPTMGYYLKLKGILNLDNRFDKLIEREEAEREIIKKERIQRNSASWGDKKGMLAIKEQNFDSTIPSTDLAKYWDGFKVGGIKPAYESIIWATKTLTDKDYFSIMVHKIEELLCHILKSNTTKEGKINTEKKIPHGINQHGIGERVVSSEAMDMLSSEFIKRYKSLSIVSSWKNILEETLKAGNMSTTEMASYTTTDLKILNYLLIQNTRKNAIHPKKTPQDGEELNASLVVDILTGVLAKLNAILISSTIGLAISQEEKQASHHNLKPNFSPITWAVKPPEGSYVDNVLKWGVGAVNVDECRVGTTQLEQEEMLKMSKGFVGKKMGRPELINYGYEASMPIKTLSEPHTKGRFPANIILDEEAGRMLDEQSGDKCGGRWSRLKTSKRTPGTSFDCGVKNIENANQYIGDYGGASRFFYCAKASRGERNAGLDGMEEKGGKAGDLTCRGNNNPVCKICDGSKIKRGNELSRKICKCENPEWQTINKKQVNLHPCVKPIKLFEYLIKLVTREGQIILDPFIGSGTTAIAAHNTGRKCIGIEKEDEYLAIAKRRIDYWENQPKQMEMGL